MTGKFGVLQKIILPKLPVTNKAKPAGKDIQSKSL